MMTDARRVGPMMIMLVGLGLVLSAFVSTPASRFVNVGGVNTSTSVCVAIGVVACPTTTTAPTTTVAPTTSVATVPGAVTTPTSAAPAPTDETEPAAARPAPSDPGQGQLALTGTPSTGLLIAGLVLLMLGSALLLASRRPSRSGAHSRR